MEHRTLCTVVVPVHNEEENLSVFYDGLAKEADIEPLDWEFLFVDDGSSDRSSSILDDLADRDQRVSVVTLSRNYGSHVAVAAGLNAAKGDIAIIMAADLQDPPHVIHELLARRRDGFDVVWAVRSSRKDPLAKKIFARIFYRLIRRIALPSYPEEGTGSFCLISRQVIDALNAFPEHNRVTFGLIAWSGFRQTSVSFDRPARHAGESKWSFARQVKAAIDTILGFSYFPVRFISLLGILVSLASFVYGLVVVLRRLIIGTVTPGWASLIVIMLFLGGMQLLVMGVLGEYLWRILEESRRRPLYFVYRDGRRGSEVRALEEVATPAEHKKPDFPGT